MNGSGRDADPTPWGRVALTLAVAWAAALACERLGTPLPWMIGPLLATAACSVAGAPVAASGVLRHAGQWSIGVALGLYFTPPVLSALGGLAWVLAAGVAWAFAIAWLFYRWLWATSGPAAGVDRATAFFAAAIGGASEMATMAERHGGQVDRVASAHSMRLLLVVMTLPFAFQAAGVHGQDVAPPALTDVRLPGLLVLLAASAAGALVLQRLGWPNPWVLGSLAVTAAITAFGVELSALPRQASQAGQLFIGVALGTRFTPAFVRAAPRWLAATALGTLAMILASAGFAWALAQGAGLHPATVLLGTSPGGIAEMCITAKVLQLGVPVVTAFHVTRYVAVVLLTPAVFRLEMRRTAAADAAR